MIEDYQTSNLLRWYLLAYFFEKRILIITKYITYDNRFLAIIKTFKTWQYNLKDYKYMILITMNNNNLC